MLLALLVQFASAQQPGAIAPPQLATPAQSSTGMPASATDERYRIGPDDVLDIRVFNRPQLSREAVRVDGRGMIRMPLIEGEIQAGCRTESELEKEIATRYLKYQKNPQVNVFVKEYQSKPVAVIGAVNQPGRFQLQRRVRLLELLAYAGGQSDRAGRSIQIVHSEVNSICEKPAGNVDEDLGLSFVAYNLNDTLKGDEKANPYVRPGDIVSLPDAEQVYVIGNVIKPVNIPLKEPITVSRAIAIAGGTMPDSKTDKIRIIRQVQGSTNKTEIIVNLTAISKQQAEDVLLQPNDVVEVPTSSGKRFLRTLAGAVVPSIAQLPVRVIP
jgi:polysaccharide export outer membrane protein